MSNVCPNALAPGASCTTEVEFVPATAGAQAGNLTLTSSTLASGVSVPLQGAGVDFSLALSGAGSQTVVAGTAASYKLVLTPLNGSSGTFAFACDALPTNALCLFNPPAQTLTGGVTGNVTVSVSTGSPTSRLRPNGFNLWAVIPLACGVLLLPMRRRRRQLLRMWVPLALLGVLLGVASCTSSCGGTGGGGGTSGGSGGAGQTPPGTYSIPLTVTSTGILHSVTVTWVVD